MRIAVIGVGLIGGSIGLAAGERLHAETVGFDLDADALARARARGAITHVAASLDEAVEDADACFIAAPVGALPDIARRVLDRASGRCVVSDVGSTKRGVVAAIDDPRFIGGHPMTGAETAGVEHARGDLFDGSVWFITPGPHADYGAVFTLTELIGQLGATPLGMTAEAHDALMADISQLPHVLANVLIGETAARHASREGQIWPVGPSFRDATRVAGANTAIWTDIYMSNRDALGEALDGVIARLTEVRAMLARGDAAGLRGWNDAAAAARRGLDLPPPLAGIARTGRAPR